MFANPRKLRRPEQRVGTLFNAALPPPQDSDARLVRALREGDERSFERVVAEQHPPASGAGFGSVVAVHDLDTGERREHTLMLGALVDIDAGQVSLAAPVGQALIGKAPGSVVPVALPHRLLRLRITGLTTLRDRVAEPPLTA